MTSSKWHMRSFLLFLSLCIAQQSCAFSLKSLSPSKLYQKFCTSLDKEDCKHWGAEEASPLHQETIREFLQHLGVKNPESVPIRKFCKNAVQDNPRCHAIATISSIWINEEKLPPEEALSSSRLYVFAHEACHFALQQKHMHIIGILYLYCNPCLPPAGILLTVASNAILINKLIEGQFNKPTLIIALMALLNNQLARLQTINSLAIQAYSRWMEKEADIAAARLLCQLGYKNAVEDVIEQYKKDLEQGLCMDCIHHPPLEQEIEYLQQVLDEWNKEDALEEETPEPQQITPA